MSRPVVTPPPALPELKPAERDEAQLGFRCKGCGHKIEAGYAYQIVIRGLGRDMRPTTMADAIVTCGRDACPLDQWVRPLATLRSPINFEWLQPLPSEQAAPTDEPEQGSGAIWMPGQPQ